MMETLENQVGANSVQKAAWQMLLEIGLPSKRSEAYKHTPITQILEKNIDWSVKRSGIVDQGYFYKADGIHLVMINGEFSAEHSVVSSDLTVEIRDIAEGKHDPFSLLNAALASHELHISSKSELPIFIYHFNSNGISSPRIKVEVSKNNSIQVVEKVVSDTIYTTFTNSYIEFNIGHNAKAYHTKVQNYHEKSFTHETVFAKVNRDGKFYNNTFSFEGALIRNNLTINLDDENGEGHMHGLFLLDKKSHVDNNTTVDHIKPNSFSDELYKGILDEKSTGVFNGKIYVRPDAQKTNAFQTNNNILLSDEATIHTKPQLEIWADDVKCSHGCTSGQLDKDAIFYLRSRGIDEKSAKALLLNSFAKEALKEVHVEVVMQEIQQLIDKKLA